MPDKVISYCPARYTKINIVLQNFKKMTNLNNKMIFKKIIYNIY